MKDINDMMFKQRGMKKGQRPVAAGLGKSGKNGANLKNDATLKSNMYSTMSNNQTAANNTEEVEQQEAKVDIHQSLGSKKIQEEFDMKVNELFSRIGVITDKVIDLNKTLNQRNNTLVQDVSQIIHEVLHDTSEVAAELNHVKKQSGPDPLKIQI